MICCRTLKASPTAKLSKLFASTFKTSTIAFLIFAKDKQSAHYILQQLLVLFRNNFQDSDILYKFSQCCQNWRKPLLEALTIINARKIIRKLGFDYQTMKAIFLPHISQTSNYINLIVKNLYILCEKLKISEGGKLILDQNNDSFMFYDHSFLEMYFLYWITESKISVDPPNLDILISYFKAKERDSLKELLLDAIKFYNISESSKVKKEATIPKERPKQVTTDNNQFKESLRGELSFQPKSMPNLQVDRSTAYRVRKEFAGYLLIINQNEFEGKRETDPELQEYLPEIELKNRTGTDKDRDRLKEVFSQFGYRVEVKENLLHHEILHQVEEVAKRSLIYDSFIVCILSHGMKGHVYGIQIEPDGPISIPIQQDILLGLSTVSGFASFRHKENGSWYIQTICKKIEELGHIKHFTDILRTVTRESSFAILKDRKGHVDLTGLILAYDSLSEDSN
uniref:Caspase family p20 domain-containing protein n=1 Tax=Megaselia scalaris TaxID=36166 RepID=T1GWX8_MEGSC